MRPLLVLRPEPGAAATVARAEALGLEAIAAPLFTIVPTPWHAPDPAAHDALMLTSANAIRHGGEALALYHALPVYAVGAATAAAAHAAGFPDVRTGAADATALLALMIAGGVARPLHLAGREHRDAGHPTLSITRRIVYSAEAATALPALAQAALASGAIALLHSPRAGALLANLAGDRASIPIAAISAAAADAAGEGWLARAIAATPDDAALLAAARKLV